MMGPTMVVRDLNQEIVEVNTIFRNLWYILFQRCFLQNASVFCWVLIPFGVKNLLLLPMIYLQIIR